MTSPSSTHPLRAAVGFAAIVLLGFGLTYSLIGMSAGRLLFPEAATGSMIVQNGQVVGSRLVSQPFAADIYFHSRPSAADHNAMDVSGSNEARTHPDLRERIQTAIDTIALREGVSPDQVPSDLVTQSGSGIDPHVSPASAQIQIARVAAVRGLSEEEVSRLVSQHTHAPTFGLLGQPRVHVLELNLALDALTATSVAQ